MVTYYINKTEARAISNGCRVLIGKLNDVYLWIQVKKE